MAMDTATRRAAAISFGRVNLLPLPVPDGAVGAGDRAHVLRLYSGLFPSIYSVSVTETMTLGDAVSSLGVLGSGVTETLTFADTVASIGIFQHSVTEAFTLSDAGKADVDNAVRMGYILRPPKNWNEVQSVVHKLNEMLRRVDKRLRDLE